MATASNPAMRATALLTADAMPLRAGSIAPRIAAVSGDTVTVNYHGVVWGKDTPFDSSFDRHQPASFGIGVGQVIKGWDQTVPGHNVGSRLVVSIPPEYGYGSRGIPQAGIGGEDTLVFVIDIISTR